MSAYTFRSVLVLASSYAYCQPAGSLDSTSISALANNDRRNLESGIAKTDSGYKWGHLRDRTTGVDFLGAEGSEIFALHVIKDNGAKEKVHSSAEWDVQQSVSQNTRFLRFKHRSLSIEIEIEIAEERDARKSKLSVTRLAPSSPTVESIEFPLLSIRRLGEEGDNVVHFPDVSGRQVADPWGADFRFQPTLDYPNGWVRYQEAGLYGNGVGVYIATEDPSGHQKYISVIKVHDRLSFSFNWILPELGVGEPYQLPGNQVIAAVSPGWEPAAKRYRAAMIKPQSQVKRKSIPAALWLITSCAPDDATCLDALVAAITSFHVPVAVHWYVWHRIPFDTLYPNFLPPKPGFKEAVQKLQSAGALVFPYINAHLWDRRTPDFENEGKSQLVRNRAGKMVGFDQFLMRVCSSSNNFYNRITNIIAALLNDYRVDGVYLDQLTAVPPYSCFHGMHQHAPGGGDWWVSKVRDFFSALTHRFPEAYFLGEGASEPYVGSIHGNLNYQSTIAHLPILQMIYGQSEPGIGRANQPGNILELQAQAFAFGDVPGWLESATASVPFFRDSIKNFATLRWHVRDFLQEAQMQAFRPLHQYASYGVYRGRGQSVWLLANGTNRPVTVERNTLLADSPDCEPTKMTIVLANETGQIMSQPFSDTVIVLPMFRGAIAICPEKNGAT